jgi:hypothetical protein
MEKNMFPRKTGVEMKARFCFVMCPLGRRSGDGVKIAGCLLEDDKRIKRTESGVP